MIPTRDIWLTHEVRYALHESCTRGVQMIVSNSRLPLWFRKAVETAKKILRSNVLSSTAFPTLKLADVSLVSQE
jgi:hypothetical protein